MARTIIIDCDPGVDDTIEILIALGAPDLNILGLTTVGGNVSAEQTQINARGIAALAGCADLPVLAGCSTPLSGAIEQSIVDRGKLIHGSSGIDGLILPELSPQSTQQRAVDFMIDQIRSHPARTISIAASGALTNIATAFKQAPDIIDRIAQIVLMGGAFGNPGGNVKPHAEFNIHVDPLAAQIVFSKAIDIVAIPLDITHQTTYDKPIRDRIRSIDGFGPNIATMLDKCAQRYPGFNDEAPLHDPHTITYMLNPALYTMQTGRVTVHADGDLAGKTEFTPDPNGNVQTPLSVDAAGFFDLVIGRLSTCAERLVAHPA